MLSLDNYFFPIINIEADPTYVDTGSEPAFEIDLAGTFSPNKNEKTCTAVLEIKVRPQNDEATIPYKINLTAVGAFSIPDGVADLSDFDRRASVFAFSILYTSSREMILTLTSRGPWKKVLLPVHHFYSSEVSNTPPENLDLTQKIQ